MIHVCSLARLHRTVEETGARHIVTLMKDISIVERPAAVDPKNHLHICIDDITCPVDGYTHPCKDHVTELVRFVESWDRGAPMVIHCYAGISRSTASAYTAACVLNPDRDEMEIANDLRRASRTAMPNNLIVALADDILGRKGRMIAAIEAIGPGDMALEANPFVLDVR
jgi:predicted protein tyrosine phosphatase